MFPGLMSRCKIPCSCAYWTVRATFAINSTALTHRYRRASDDFVELAALDELHAEVAGAIPLANFMDWNNAWVLEARGGIASDALRLSKARGRSP